MKLWIGQHRRLACLLVGACILGAAILALVLSYGQNDGSLERVRARGVLRVGMDASFPPFAWLDGESMPIGYEVELAHDIAAQLGVRAQIVNIAFDSLYDALQADRVDAIISGLSYDERRTKEVIYSQPYFDAGQLLVLSTTAKDNTDEKSDVFRLLENRRVAVEWGSTGDMKARQLQSLVVRCSILSYLSAEEALAALVHGESDVAIADAVSVYRFAAAHPGTIRVAQQLTEEPYVIATSARSPSLAKAIEAALDTLKRTGTLDHLRDRWLTATDLP